MSMYRQEQTPTTVRIEELKQRIEDMLDEVVNIDRPKLRVIQGGKSSGEKT